MFENAFVQNELHAQAMQEQFFENLVMMGVTAVSMLKGGQMVHYVYNQARRLWQTQETAPPSSDSSIGGRSTRRALGFEDIVLTPCGSAMYVSRLAIARTYSNASVGGTGKWCFKSFAGRWSLFRNKDSMEIQTRL